MNTSASHLLHKIGNSLSAISMNLEFAMEGIPRDARFVAIRDALSDCQSSSQELLRAVAELAAVAKL